jgi:hypothetical protein
VAQLAEGNPLVLKDHPDVKYVSSGVDIGPDGTAEYVVTIYTDLKLDVTDPAHDQKRLDDLISAANEHLMKFKAIVHRVRIRQAPG